MGRIKGAPSEAIVPTELWTTEDIPAPRLLDVLTQLAHFLNQIGYKKTLTALTKEATAKSEIDIEIAAWAKAIAAKSAVPLLSLHEEWHEGHDNFATLQAIASAKDSSDSDSDGHSESEKDEAEGVLVDVEAEETSDDDSEEKEDSDSSDDSSSSEEEEKTPAKESTKRKRVVSPPTSSDSSSDSSSSDDDSSSSSDSDAPPAKKACTTSPAKSKKATKTKAKALPPSSSDSDSSSSSSDSSDSSSSESEAEAPSPPPVKKEKKNKKVKVEKAVKPVAVKAEVTSIKDNGSASSATLQAESSPEKEEAPVSHVHPDRLRQVPQAALAPTTKKAIAAEAKKQQIPFSRIPADQKVDDKFASNEYVSYDYADRAHRDLIVTRGKGFTKEKNKKKRGSYRGGAIDLTPKGIKFDD